MNNKIGRSFLSLISPFTLFYLLFIILLKGSDIKKQLNLAILYVKKV